MKLACLFSGGKDSTYAIHLVKKQGHEVNNLSILTSSIFNIAEMDKSKKQNLLKQAEIESSKQELNDQTKYLIDQKIEILKTLN